MERDLGRLHVAEARGERGCADHGPPRVPGPSSSSPRGPASKTRGVGDAEILEALQETTARVIEESRQLRAQSEKLIAQSQRLRRKLRHVAAQHREKTEGAVVCC